MFLQTPARRKIELVPIESRIETELGRIVVRAAELHDAAGRLTSAATAFFGLRSTVRGVAARALASKEPPPGVFREADSGLLRVVHKELVVRFKSGLSKTRQKRILSHAELQVRATNRFVPDQFVVKSKQEKRTGVDLVDVANQLMDMDEVVFATPNFVSEYQRLPAPKIPSIPIPQWHLKNTAAVPGQKLGEDVDAEDAWKLTQGRPSIVVAVLDDGVDVDHPNLKTRIKRINDPQEPRDKVGRDFFIPDENNVEHFNPRPKIFQFPFDELQGNDIHGTPCAGVVVAPGKKGDALGIAPKCRVLAVKIFHADFLASDARVADAIRYAALHADILSCSWSSGVSPDIELAIQDAGTIGRGGKGSAVFCAAGNGFGRPVAFPANLPEAIAVGASTDQAKLADYSNVGPELWVVAPSSGGMARIYTTDVSIPNRGFNLGTPEAGGKDGLHTNAFGGTSSATPLAAGVGALVLSVKKNLTRDQLKNVLKDTADPIGDDHDPGTGHSPRFGYGRVNAAKAVAHAKRL